MDYSKGYDAFINGGESTPENEGTTESVMEKTDEQDTNQQIGESIAAKDTDAPTNTPELPVSHESSSPVDPPKRRGRRPKNVANTNANASEKTTGKGFANQFGLQTGFHAQSTNVRLDDLRLSSNFCSEIDVVEVASAYEIRKPGRHEFIRVHPGEDYQIVVGALKEKIGMGEKLWLAGSDVRAEFPEETVPINLRLAINRANRIFLWPLNISSNGNSNPWSQTALQAAEMAKTTWVRLTPDTNEGRYRIFAAKGNLSDPLWPDSDFGNILELAFAGKVITDRDHPYLRQLRGEE